MAKAPKPGDAGSAPVAVNTPLAGLAALRETLAPGEPQPAPAVAVRAKAPARAVVRIERKGRGGKEATIIEKLDLPLAELASWCKQLKQALGCGGQVEGDAIVLHGDVRTRVADLLSKKGIKKVTLAG